MNISGVMAIKNGVRLGYPFVEAILSLLPLCDEIVVSEGYSEDETFSHLQRLQKIHRKIRLSRDRWPQGLSGGEAIGVMQTRALRRCRGRWIYLLQADEIMPAENVRYLRELCAPHLMLRRLMKERGSTPPATGALRTGHVPSRAHRRDLALARLLEVFTNRIYNGFAVDFAHVGENFQSVHFDDPYRWAVRLVRNRRSIYSGDDGWQLQGAGCWPIGVARLPHPIWHLGYVFPVSAWRKTIHHAALYPGHEYFDHAVPRAQKLLTQHERGQALDLPRESPLGLPPMIKGLVGTPEYFVREELFNDSFSDDRTN